MQSRPTATEDPAALSMATPALAHWQAMPGPLPLHDAQLLHNFDRPSPAEHFWRVPQQPPPQPSLFSQPLLPSSWLSGLPSQPVFPGAHSPPAAAIPGMPTAQRPARLQQHPGRLQPHAPAPAVGMVAEPSGPPFLLPQLTQLLESSDPDSWPAEQRPLSMPLASSLYGPMPLPLLDSFPASPSLPPESPTSESEPGSPAMSMQQSVPLPTARARQPLHGNAIVFPWPYQNMPSPGSARRAASTPALHAMDTVAPSDLVPLPMAHEPFHVQHQPSSSDPVGHRVRSSAVSRAYPTHEEPPRTPLSPTAVAPRPQRVTRARTGQAQSRQQAAQSHAPVAAAAPPAQPEQQAAEFGSWLSADLIASNPLQDPDFPHEFEIAPLYPPASGM